MSPVLGVVVFFFFFYYLFIQTDDIMHFIHVILVSGSFFCEISSDTKRS